MKVSQKMLSLFVDALTRTDLSERIENTELRGSVALYRKTVFGRATSSPVASMSIVIAEFIDRIEPCLSRKFLNSEKYRSALPMLFVSGNDHEQARLGMMIDWMFAEVLPFAQLDAASQVLQAEWNGLCGSRNSIEVADALRNERRAMNAQRPVRERLLHVSMLHLFDDVLRAIDTSKSLGFRADAVGKVFNHVLRSQRVMHGASGELPLSESVASELLLALTTRVPCTQIEQ